MKCPYCHDIITETQKKRPNGDDNKTGTQVLETRAWDSGFRVQRRRRCLNSYCPSKGKAFVTYEEVPIKYMIIRKDEQREIWDELELYTNVFANCYPYLDKLHLMMVLKAFQINSYETGTILAEEDMHQLIFNEIKKYNQKAAVTYAINCMDPEWLKKIEDLI